MTQRTTIGGEEYEVLHVSRFDDDIGSVLGGTHLCHLRKVKKPAPKESEQAWSRYDTALANEWGEGQPPFITVAEIKNRARLLATAIKAEVKEEIYFDLKMRGIDK